MNIVSDASLLREASYSNGQWLAGGADVISGVNPAAGKVIGTVPRPASHHGIDEYLKLEYICLGDMT